jgi:CheY-like chemotaxis protein
VLVVDDEDCIRSLAQRILTRNGYRVLVARNAAEAVERVAGHQESLDLLLTDVVMPGRSGYQLAAQVRELRPEVEVLFMSGYTGEVLSHQRDPGHRGSFLQKPFTAKSLLESVQSVLDGSRACQP